VSAGKGAEEQRRLAADRVERLKRQLQQAERDERAWAAGAEGETKVAEELKSLDLSGWLTLHDVHWPGRPKANLDHVLIGPGGVLVIDAKNWSGDVSMRAGIVYQNGRSRQRELIGASQQAAAVAVLLQPEHRRFVQAWLCLVGHENVSFAASGGVRVHGIAALVEAIKSLPAVWDTETVQAVHVHLRKALGSTSSPFLLTTAQLWPAAQGPASAPSPPSASKRPQPTSAYVSRRPSGAVRAHQQRRPRPQFSPVRTPTTARRLAGCLVLLLTVSFALVAVAIALGLFLRLTQPTPTPTSPSPASPASVGVHAPQNRP
jgi:Nuclease-related domain